MESEIEEIKQAVAKIDERTAIILENQVRNTNALEAHEARDRIDFKEVHGRINRIERRQNWFLGIGTGAMFFFVTMWDKIKEMFGG